MESIYPNLFLVSLSLSLSLLLSIWFDLIWFHFFLAASVVEFIWISPVEMVDIFPVSNLLKYSNYNMGYDIQYGVVC